MLGENRPAISLSETLPGPEQSLYKRGFVDVKNGSRILVLGEEEGVVPARYIGRVYPFHDAFASAEIRIASEDKLHQLSVTGIDLAPNMDNFDRMDELKAGERIGVIYDWEVAPAIVFKDSPENSMYVHVHRLPFVTRRGKHKPDHFTHMAKTQIRYYNADLQPGKRYDFVLRTRVGESPSGIPYYRETDVPCYGVTNNATDGITIIPRQDIHWINLKKNHNAVIPFTPGLEFGALPSVIGVPNYYPFEQVMVTDVLEEGGYDIVSASRPDARARVSPYQVVETQLRRVEEVIGKRAQLITDATVQKITEDGEREDASFDAGSEFVIAEARNNFLFVESLGIAQQHWYEVDPALLALVG